MTATALKIKVFLDGSFLKDLSNGEFAYFKVRNGKHHLYFEAMGYDRSPSFEFIGSSNEIGYEVSFTSLAVALFHPLPSTTILVNKIKETQPGSFRG